MHKIWRTGQKMGTGPPVNTERVASEKEASNSRQEKPVEIVSSFNRAWRCGESCEGVVDVECCR